MAAARNSRGRAAVKATRRRHGPSLPKRRQFHGFLVLFLQLLALAVPPASPIAEASSLAELSTPDAASGPSCPLLGRHPGSENHEGVLVRVPCVQHLPNHDEKLRDDPMESPAEGGTLDGSSGGSVRREDDHSIHDRTHALVTGGETTTVTTTINGDCYRCVPRTRPAGTRLRSDDRGRKGGLRQFGRGWGGSNLGEEDSASGSARDAEFQEQGGEAPTTGGEASLVGAPPAGEGFSATAVVTSAEGEGRHAAGRGMGGAAVAVLLPPSSVVDDENGKTGAGSVSTADREHASTTENANQGRRDRQVARPASAPGAELHAASAGPWLKPREELPAVARALQAGSTSSSVEPDPAPSPAPSSPLASSETAHPVALETASFFAPITPLTFAPVPDIVAQPFERITFAPYRPLTFAPLADIVPAPTESRTPTPTPDPTPAPFTPPATPEPSPYPTPDPTLAPVTPETDPPTYPPTPPPVPPPTTAPRTPTPVPDPTPRPTTAPLTPSTPRPAAAPPVAPPVAAPSPAPVTPETRPTPTETDPPIAAPSPRSIAPVTSPTPDVTEEPATNPSPVPSVPTIDPTVEPTNVDQPGAPAAAPSSSDVAPPEPSTAPPGSSSPVTAPPASPTYSAPPAVSPKYPPDDDLAQTENTSANGSE
ncbi:unnamed protein product, partial [Scytosiphon promiscuus]